MEETGVSFGGGKGGRSLANTIFPLPTFIKFGT